MILSDGEGKPPSSYTGPRNKFERFLCRSLFGAVVKDGRIAIDFGSGLVLGEKSEAEFLLAAPDLWTTVKVIFAPGFNIGETYAIGKWYLKKGVLADFLYSMRHQAPQFYDTYYRLMTGFRGIKHYFQQYVFTRYFTRKVRDHYDFDSKIYEMILGSSMVYTCGFFDSDPLAGEKWSVSTLACQRRYYTNEINNLASSLTDLKSVGPKGLCQFKSGRPHQFSRQYSSAGRGQLPDPTAGAERIAPRRGRKKPRHRDISQPASTMRP